MTHRLPPSALPGRRRMLAGSGAAALMLLTARRGRAQPGEHLAYVGSYTPEGKGITLWRANTGNGVMTLLNTFATENPSWIALDAQSRVLYAVNENEPEGGVTAFAVDRSSGALRQINAVSSRGKWPCHLSVHPSGKFVLVANYGTGTVAVLPIAENGALGEASDVQGDPGPLNPAQAADSPPGQTAPSDHAGPHMHMVESDPQGRFIIVNDAGRDRILRYTLDLATGKLAPAAVPPVATEPGSAPRHFVFHPNGRILYDLQEQDGMVTAYDYDPETAGLKEKQTLAVLPPGFAGSFLASELAISPDGHFLYAAVRLHDAISILSVAEDGRLTRIGEAWTRADYPRSFTIAPDGNMVFACNQRGNAITAFRVNRMQGALDFVGQYAAVGSPACMVFLG
ncbi:MAG: lactonase family protein [Rhodospirillales bacterium]|nr:lactonase family protein [Rhodospirillales bacterium]